MQHFSVTTEAGSMTGRRIVLLAGAMALSLMATAAAAQPRLPPGAPAGGPPGAPPGAPGDAAAPNPLLAFMPPRPPPTEIEKLIAALPAPEPGGGPPPKDLPADAPMPSADPRDLSGTWEHDQPLEFRNTKDMYGKLVPFNMAGAKVLERRVRGTAAGTPHLNASAICRPPGPQWQFDLNMPFQIFHVDDLIEVVFEEYHGVWNVVMDPQKYPAPKTKEYMGRAVGHWVGDTLVVESTDFKQALWLDVDGVPLSTKGKLTQRIRKVNNGDRRPYLEIITTVDDPTYYLRPWSMVRTFAWRPDLAVFREYNCEEQVGDPTVSPDAGLIPEPKD